jgi:hypothetical protein
MDTKRSNPLSRRLQEMQECQPQAETERLLGLYAGNDVSFSEPVGFECAPASVVTGGWLKDFGSASQQEPTPITVLVHLDPKDSERIDVVEHKIARLEKQIQTLTASLNLSGDIEARFRYLVTDWKTGRGHKSSVQAMAMHPAYQQIIGMGEKVLPLLLAEMEARPSHWTWALRSITGADPVPEQSRGKLKEMASAWAKWGREMGYIQ